MKTDLLLAIDTGTQSVRALVFDLHGDLIAKSRVMLDSYRSPEPGWHEHDANGFWQALCDACGGLWERAPDLRERIAGVAITTQRGTVVNLDRDGRPLRPAITWLDKRKSPVVPPISLLWQVAFGAARVGKTVRYFQREAEANWIAAVQPKLWEQTDKYLLLSGYLVYRMCGRFVDSIGSQVGYIPFDYKKLTWAAANDWKWQATAIARSMLPDLVPPGTIVGEVGKDAANATGIRRGTPLIAAAGDKTCEVLGAGCLDPSVACLSYGTAATINTASPRYLEVTPSIPPYPAAVPGTYNTEVQIFRGYWMVQWFKEQFGLIESLSASESGRSPEELFDQLVDSVPPGAAGLVLQPYWGPGIKMPGPEAKGAVIGFSDVHTRAHLYRAILEGLAFGLREGKERIERRTKVAISSLRVCGGGSQSDAALQLTADIFGLPAARPHVYEASGLGAAIDAAVGLKLHPDFATAVREMTRIQRVFEPHAGPRKTYDALYRRVYKPMYARLKPLYEALHEIAG